ncbi:hypothetical protein ACTXT7_015472 [Hymenolepis weldensis]
MPTTLSTVLIISASALFLYWLHQRRRKFFSLSPPFVCKIFYGTESGTAERYSYRLEKLLSQSPRVKVSVSNLSGFDQESLGYGKNHLNVFIVATYADGKAPDDAVAFDNWLRERRDTFSDLNFVVFGLGDSAYLEFNEFAKQVDRRFHQLGGNRKMPVCLGDGAHNIEADFRNWQASLCKLYELTECKVDALPTPNDEYEVIHPTASEVKSLGGAFTGEPEHLNSYRLNAPYIAGDHLGVLPCNSEKLVFTLCNLLNVDPHDYIHIRSLSAPGVGSKKHPNHFPTPCSYLTAFTHYLDIMFPIRFDLIEALISCTESEKERAFLRNLIEPKTDKNDENSYEQWILASRRGIVEVLEDLPSCRPSPDLVCRLLPRLQPRFYSVASSARYQPNRLRLIVKVVEYTSLTCRLHKGIASNYLASLVPGNTVPVYLRRSEFKLPRSPLTPIIMVCAGTGLAPFLGFLQERTFIKSKGGRLGDAMLFYGCRNRDQDCILSHELNEALEGGVLSHLQIAYSRDQEHKIYVQHLMRYLSETVWSLLKSQGGYIYVCGDSKTMARDVKQTLVEIFQQHGAMTQLESEEYFQELKSTNRCLFDAWS